MQLNKYSLTLISIVVTAIAIYNKSARSTFAHSTRNHHPSQETRVGFNQQMSYSLGAANRAQQAYYFELGKFAENPEELSQAGFNLPDNDNYEITIETEGNAAFIYGIPQENYGTYKEWSGSTWSDGKEPLYSYISGIAYSSENGSFQSILCVSNTIGEQKLEEPKIIDSKFVCAEETEEIR